MLGVSAAKDKPGLGKFRDIFRIDLVAVAVALHDLLLAVLLRQGSAGRVRLARDGPLFEHAGVGAQPHGAAVLLLNQLIFLVGHDVYHYMRRVFVYLGSIGTNKPGFIARIFDTQQLHAVAQAKVRYLLLARILHRRDDALHPPRAKPPGPPHSLLARGGLLLSSAPFSIP